MKVQLAVLSLVTVARAVPQPAFPINSQVPSVARVSEPFSFVFSASTFSSDTVITEYTLLGAPSWLHLGAGNRTFSGVPSPKDVGPFGFQLTATDPSGSAGMDVTFVVSPNPAPVVLKPLADQLRAFGPTSGPSSLLLSPATNFAFTFDKETFKSSRGALKYYAVLADNTPLPSWIQFDPQTLSFSGRTLPWTSQTVPPQQYDIQLIGSDVAGFSGAAASLSFVISNHLFFFDNNDQTLIAILGVPVNIANLRTHLLLDGRPIRDEDLRAASATIPDWLHFDNRTFEISGTPRFGVSSQLLTVSAFDVYGDAATCVVHLQISSGLFTGSIGDLTATVGKEFIYNVSRTLFSSPNLDITAVFTPPSAWLTFNPEVLQLKGKVPMDTSPTEIEVSLIASSKILPLSDSETFRIRIQKPGASTTRSTPTSMQTDPSRPTETPLLGATYQKWKVAAAVLLPFFALIAAMAALICWGKHRRKKKMQPRQSPVVSRPMQREEPVEDPWPSPEKSRKQGLGAPRRAPILRTLSGMWKSSTDFHSQNYQRPRDQPSPRGGGNSIASLDRELTYSREFTRELNRPPLGNSASSQTTCNFSFKDPGRITRPQRPQSTLGPVGERALAARHSRASSCRLTRHSVSAQRSVSGVGHGSGSYGPPGYGIPRRSWRQTSSSHNWGTVRNGDNSGLTESTGVLIDQFPSIRVVTSPDPARLSPTEAQRRSFARRRGQLPFFGRPFGFHSSHASSHQFGHTLGNLPSSPNPDNSGGAGSLLDRVQYELSTQGTVESLPLSPTPEFSRAFTSNLGAGISKASLLSKLSDSSSRFRSADESPRLENSPRDAESMVDSSDEGSWYHRPYNFFGYHGMSLAAESKPDILEYETVRLRGVASPRNTHGLPTASSMLKLVDFKGKRLVSVEVSPKRLKNSESETRDIAFL